MYNVGELIRDETFLEELGESLAGHGAPPVLRCAKIKITSRCNLRCVMCKYWQTTSEETLSSDRWRAVFREMAELGCKKIHFSGGEVFLRKDFLDLVEDAIACGMKVNMTTNGTLVDREAARRMAKMGVNSVSISLDGPDDEAHNAVRGRAYAFDRSVQTIKWLKRDQRLDRVESLSKKLKVRINFVVMRGNYKRLPEMVTLAGELGAEELLPMPVDEKKVIRNRLTKAQIRRYNREIAPEVVELRQKYGFSTHPALVYPFGVTEEEVRYSAKGLYARGTFERKACLAPWLHTFIAWNGDVYLCCMTNGRMEPLGNVASTRVGDVFHGEGYRRIREEFSSGNHLAPCHRCDLFLKENAALHAALDQAGDRGGAVGEDDGLASPALEAGA